MEIFSFSLTKKHLQERHQVAWLETGLLFVAYIQTAWFHNTRYVIYDIPGWCILSCFQGHKSSTVRHMLVKICGMCIK